jgi:hypothetical protein
VLGAVFALALGAALWSGIFSGDAFFVLAEGRAVLERGWSLPEDPFVSGAVGPVLLHFPFVSFAGFALESLGGVALVQFVGGVVSATALTAAVALAARRAGVRLVLTGLVGLLAAVDAELFSVRAQPLATLWLVGLVVWVRALARGAGAAARRWRPAWGGLVVGALWVNTHPSAPLAVALPLGVGLLVLIEGETGAAARAAALGRLGFGAAAGLLVTPWGPALILDDLRMASMAGTRLITLFRPPVATAPLLGLLGLLIGVAAAAARRAPRKGWLVDSAVLLGLVVAALRSRRFVELALVWSLPVAAPFVRAQLLAWGRAARIRGVAVQRWGRCLVAGACTAAFVVAGFLAARVRDPFDTHPVVVDTCVAARGEPHVLPLWGWGGYLDWAWGGRPPHLVDGRTQLFPDSLILDYVHLENAGPDVDRLLDLYEIDLVMMPDALPLARHVAAHPGWRECCRDGIYAAWARTR